MRNTSCWLLQIFKYPINAFFSISSLYPDWLQHILQKLYLNIIIMKTNKFDIMEKFKVSEHLARFCLKIFSYSHRINDTFGVLKQIFFLSRCCRTSFWCWKLYFTYPCEHYIGYIISCYKYIFSWLVVLILNDNLFFVQIHKLLSFFITYFVILSLFILNILHLKQHHLLIIFIFFFFFNLLLDKKVLSFN